MKHLRLILLSIFCVGSAYAQILGGITGSYRGCDGSAQYLKVMDNSGGQYNVAPTTAMLKNSDYPSFSSTSNYIVNNSQSVISFQAIPAGMPSIPNPCLVGATWNASPTLAFYQPGNPGAPTQAIGISPPSTGQGATVSSCQLYYSSEPASGATYISGDTISIYAVGGHTFTNRYWKNTAGTTLMGTELGGGPDSTPIWTYSANTWQWVCSSITPGLTGHVQEMQAQWDQNGNYLSPTLWAANSSNAVGTDYIYSMNWGDLSNADTAPSGGKYFTLTYTCGLVSGASSCPFPLLGIPYGPFPGLAAIPPTPSQEAGSIQLNSTVTLTSLSANSPTGSPGSIYYNESGSATCGGSSTLYTGPITMGTLGSVTLSSVTCPSATNAVPSAVVNTAYTVTNAPTISSTYFYANGAGVSKSSLSSNTVGTAIPAGTLMVVSCGNGFTTAETEFRITDNAGGGTNTWTEFTLFQNSAVDHAMVSASYVSYPFTQITCTPYNSGVNTPTTYLSLTGAVVTCVTCSSSSISGAVEHGGTNVNALTWTSGNFQPTGATNGWVIFVAAFTAGAQPFVQTDTIAGNTGAIYTTEVSTLTANAHFGLFAYVYTGNFSSNQTANYTISGATNHYLIGDVVAFSW